MNPVRGAAERERLEALVAADARALAAESEELGRVFAAAHQLRPSDFRALLHILVAEGASAPLTSGELRHKMGLSAAAITYLVERMINSGHIRRESDPADRRKVILRYADRDFDVARAFFAPLAAHTQIAMADLADTELTAAHRVLTAFIDGMREFHHEVRVSGADVGTT
ncbi:DNA-binding transcriptional regulator, MarR family [Mycobacterium rhizamassiliense]|jgi:DNA-binding MarR family transcriptional regulator|uniref:DNA-binding transcriptional regulator, MarR family n=1 Tax=Mycobacterium rhizamassiliense TaxID=1841860 RepID=A0A2U3P1W6_9MYCO|nr:MarR family winged helix-turn-helix transcriptional regulator [Mycobacterium rhizamassiliense]SPM37717.1 DNA-binding transcriptional regulator, MarR family [Mycobacterium rhizamassiliense]